MAVVVVGVHERDVPLDVLERVAVADQDLGKALKALCDSPHLTEAVVVSTCLRTEVYAVVERFHDGVGDIESFFETRSGLRLSAGVAGPDGSPVPPAPVALPAEQAAREGPAAGGDQNAGGDHAAGGDQDAAGDQGARAAGGAGGLYCLYDEAAAAHLFEVAAGLDSAVLGEGEVLRQVRHAQERAHAEHASGPVLGRLFRHAVEVGKRARSETSIGRGVTSLSHAAVALAAGELGGSLGGRRVLVVGAGEMGRGMVAALERMAEPPELVVANRSHARAHEIARRLGGEGVDLSHVARVLAETDVLLTCTASPSVLFEPADVAPLMAGRPDRPLLVVDAAVPRDVDPAVGDIAGVSLRDMDDLRAFAERQMEGRRAEVERVREVLARELERHRADSAARGAVPVISSLRNLGESVRSGELARLAARLESLDEEQRAAVDAVTKGIVAKLLHEPTVRLKEAAGSPRGERLAEALRALFDL